MIKQYCELCGCQIKGQVYRLTARKDVNLSFSFAADVCEECFKQINKKIDECRKELVK